MVDTVRGNDVYILVNTAVNIVVDYAEGQSMDDGCTALMLATSD